MTTAIVPEEHQQDEETCQHCQRKQGRSQAAIVLMLMVTAIGCGIPAIATIPLMIYFVISGATPCEECRDARRAAKHKSS